jgi:hypothetical protein
MQRSAFVTEQSGSCTDWKSFPNPAEWCPSSLSFLIEKWSSHRIGFSIALRERLFGLLQCGMGLSFRKSPRFERLTREWTFSNNTCLKSSLVASALK